LHAQIAEALEAHSPELMDNQPELFAQHYAEAGLVEKSAAYWGKAGRKSAARSAMAEAAVQLQKGLDQLALLPDSRERQQQELEFRSSLGSALQAGKGFAAPETGQAYARARELWEQLGSPSEFLQVPFGQSRYHAFRSELALALRLDEDLLRLSRHHNDSAGLVLGHSILGYNLRFAGKFALSRFHLEETLARYDPITHHSLVHQAGVYPQVTCRGILGIVLFYLGYPDQALAQNNAAIAEAIRLAHPPSLSMSLTNICRLLWLVGDIAAMDARASQVIALAADQGFPFWGALGVITLIVLQSLAVADGLDEPSRTFAEAWPLGVFGLWVLVTSALGAAADAEVSVPSPVAWLGALAGAALLVASILSWAGATQAHRPAAFVAATLYVVWAAGFSGVLWGWGRQALPASAAAPSSAPAPAHP